MLVNIALPPSYNPLIASGSTAIQNPPIYLQLQSEVDTINEKISAISKCIASFDMNRNLNEQVFALKRSYDFMLVDKEFLQKKLAAIQDVVRHPTLQSQVDSIDERINTLSKCIASFEMNRGLNEQISVLRRAYDFMLLDNDALQKKLEGNILGIQYLRNKASMNHNLSYLLGLISGICLSIILTALYYKTR